MSEWKRQLKEFDSLLKQILKAKISYPILADLI